jgi:hypothetical protein
MTISEKIKKRIEGHQSTIRIMEEVAINTERNKAVIQCIKMEIVFLKYLMEDVEEMELELERELKERVLI